MSTTKKIILKVYKKRNPNEGYLKLLTITNRKPKEKSLNIKIQTKNWNADKQFVLSKEPNAKEINEKLKKILYEEQGKLIQKVKEDSLIDFAEERIEIIQVKGTKDGKLYALKKLKEYLKEEGKTDLLFSEITPLFVEKYYNYLKSTMKKKSSANAYMINFRYFVNEADKYDKYTYAKDPFKSLGEIKKEKSTLQVMTELEVEAFLEYEPKDESYLHVKSGFCFMMYCAGMRISDLLNMKWSNFRKQQDDYFLMYKTQKNKRQMHPILTLNALENLIPFIEEYGEELLKGYYKLKKVIEKDKKTLESFRQELKELKPIGIYEVYIAGKDKYQEVLHKAMKIDEEEKRIKEKIKLYREGREANRKTLGDIIADTCIRLGELYPEETVLPHSRNVPEDDFDREARAIKLQFNHRLQMIQKEMGIKTHITNHQARHVFAQRLFEAGANFHYISQNLGHASLQITERYRKQIINDKSNDVVRQFSDIMNKSDEHLESEQYTKKYITLPKNAFPTFTLSTPEDI